MAATGPTLNEIDKKCADVAVALTPLSVAQLPPSFQCAKRVWNLVKIKKRATVRLGEIKGRQAE